MGSQHIYPIPSPDCASHGLHFTWLPWTSLPRKDVTTRIQRGFSFMIAP